VSLAIEVHGTGALAKAIAARFAAGGIVVTIRDVAMPAPDADLVVWAREGGTMGDALAANDAFLRAGVASIFVLADGAELAFGPLTVPGRTACLACAFGGTESIADARPIATASAVGAVRVADDVVVAVVQAAAALSPIVLQQRVARLPRGAIRSTSAWPRFACPSCALARVVPGPFDVAAAMAIGAAPSAMSARDTGVGARRIGIVGGGTAGYLTALALRRLRPSLDVTLIESSTIPVIGVGEATTPDLVEFLLGTLGVDELELYRDVQPTWKLGIRFAWGDPSRPHFHHPFTGEHLLEAYARGRDHDLQSLSAQLMAHDRAPVLRDTGGRVVPLLSRTPYAYHLDNRRFVSFLERLASRAGVKRVDCVVEEAVLADDGSVERLRTRDGRDLSFDLYVDASGFRSILLEKALHVPFIDYASSLFCDAAIAADVPHGGVIAPYTLAETMDAGWCWGIGQRESNHRGYVFATSGLSADAAEGEMRRKNPGMGDARLIRFRSGRHTESWAKNVVAVGNAYAFVEPLESTAIHMVLHEIALLCDTLPDHGDVEGARRRFNEALGAHWDYLRGFLALHFRFNRRLDTPFWQRCRAEVDLAGAESLIEAFGEGAPLTARRDRALLEESLMRTSFFGLLGVDNVLLGQGVPTTLLTPAGDLGAFDRWARYGLPSIVARALPQPEALDAYVGWLEARRS
jgi:tryptophan halogenase